MIVVTLSSCPRSLKGDITKWLIEISPGVYVGNLSARVREKLWVRIEETVKDGLATMVYSARNEQKLQFLTHGTPWKPVDLDGVVLMKEPSKKRSEQSSANIPVKPDANFVVTEKVQSAVGLRELQNYVALDIETTGLNPDSDVITEIAMVRVRDGIGVETYQSYLKYSEPVRIPEEVQKMTGITPDILEGQGRAVNTVMAETCEFIGTDPVVCHNAEFDTSFLKKQMEKSGCSYPAVRAVDTLKEARRLVKGCKNFRLKTLAEYFGIDIEKSHSALIDAHVVVYLVENLKKLDRSSI